MRRKILLLLCVLVVFYIFTFNNFIGMSKNTTSADHEAYVELASNIAQGKGYTYNNKEYGFNDLPPLYSLTLSWLILIFGVWPFILKVQNILWMLLFTYFFYKWLEYRETKHKELLVILFAILPITIFFVGNIQSEVLYMTVTMITIYLVDTQWNKKWASLVLGISMFLLYVAFYIREVGIALFDILLIYSIASIKIKKANKLTIILFVVLVGLLFVGTKLIISNVDTWETASTRSFWMRDILHPEFGYIEWNELPGRFVINMWMYLGGALIHDLIRVELNQLLWIVPFIVIGSIAFWLIALVGILKNWKSASVWYCRGYGTIVCLFPWVSFRYLFPILPFALYFFYSGLKTFPVSDETIRKSLLILISVCVLFNMYYISILGGYVLGW